MNTHKTKTDSPMVRRGKLASATVMLRHRKGKSKKPVINVAL